MGFVKRMRKKMLSRKRGEKAGAVGMFDSSYFDNSEVSLLDD